MKTRTKKLKTIKCFGLRTPTSFVIESVFRCLRETKLIVKTKAFDSNHWTEFVGFHLEVTFSTIFYQKFRTKQLPQMSFVELYHWVICQNHSTTAEHFPGYSLNWWPLPLSSSLTLSASLSFSSIRFSSSIILQFSWSWDFNVASRSVLPAAKLTQPVLANHASLESLEWLQNVCSDDFQFIAAEADPLELMKINFRPAIASCYPEARAFGSLGIDGDHCGRLIEVLFCWFGDKQAFEQGNRTT